MRKPAFCICENKDADQLRGNREADQRLCFRYTDSMSFSFLNTKFQASSHLLWMYSLVCVRPGRKPRRPVFSERGSYIDKRRQEHSRRTCKCTHQLLELVFLKHSCKVFSYFDVKNGKRTNERKPPMKCTYDLVNYSR